MLPKRSVLARPARGGSTRVQVGSHELVLEHGRGCFTLLWSDGREARRHVLGLPPHGDLTLELCVPRLPVRVVPREQLTLAPKGRVRGYVQVPLVPTLSIRGALGREQVLIELPNRELAPEWDEAGGHAFRVVSPWHGRFPMRTGEPRAIVPTWLRNDGDVVTSPGHLPITLVDGDLQELRGSLVAPPQRLRCQGAECDAEPRGRKVAP